MPTNDKLQACALCHPSTPGMKLELPFSRIELILYRGGFVIVLLLELSKFIKHLFMDW